MRAELAATPTRPQEGGLTTAQIEEAVHKAIAAMLQAEPRLNRTDVEGGR